MATQLSSEQVAENTDTRVGTESPLVSVVMPCLNEERTVAGCIREAFAGLAAGNLDGEIIIADNGSTDDSVNIAIEEAARVVHVAEKGYGSALRGGFAAARGKYIVMGDADGSYDFGEIPRFVAKLEEGYDLVMGNRFAGGIEKGAMPWHHRYIGNPVLSGIGRLLYGGGCKDWHCGLRGFDRRNINALDLKSRGMELASEMIIRARGTKLNLTEIPTTLSPDGRDRAPHLRSFRDGFRHLQILIGAKRFGNFKTVSGTISFAILLCIVLHSLTIGCSHEDSTEPVKYEPRTQVFDLGDVPPDSEVNKTFTVSNPVNRDLVVEKLSASCGCIERSLSKEALRASESAELRVKFQTPSVRGSFNHTVDIQFESGEMICVQITGTVGAWFRTDRSKLDFGHVTTGKSANEAITVWLHEDLQYEQSSESINMPYTSLKTLQDSKNQITYAITFEPPNDAVCQQYAGELILGWDNDARLMRVPLTAIVRSTLQATPEKLFLGILKQGEIAERTIALHNHNGWSELTTEISSELMNIVEMKWNSEGKEIVLQFDSNRATAGAHSGSVLIRSNEATVIVPVIAFVEL